MFIFARCQSYMFDRVHAFYINTNFIKNTKLKLTQIQAKATQHTQAEFSPFENYSSSSSRYYPKMIGPILKYLQINKCVCFNDIIGLRFCAGSNPARIVSEIRDGEDL